ncbi:decarboxylase [Marivita lacus]|uniref:Decarboxylase n=1 Tax=Marivita lacus TaxID=1323742 RepID=A0ABQ1LBJ3_9RHOB|nr:malonyl-CoA decarboxylase [Marivita lacus]GGC22277.1 decarboxylase [Marivita lacus]
MKNSARLLSDLLERVAEVGRTLRSYPPGQTGILDQCHVLLSSKGEATSLATAREILDRFPNLAPGEKHDFFCRLLSEFGPDMTATAASIAAWQATPDSATLRRLHFASEPRSQELVRRLNRAPGGTGGVVAMRKDLLACLKAEPGLKALDDDFRHLLSSWFNRGFLELRQITWSTPAEILERIITYEAVHEIGDWSDLRRRVAEPDRRLYAFFHPALHADPLIFVEVALTREVPEKIGTILAAQREITHPNQARTAVFYSISNCQEGLRGISFGNFLIKQVVEELRKELPNLTTFVTLSPVPGLRRWAEAETLPSALRATVAQIARSGAVPDQAMAELAAFYLAGTDGSGSGARDPVARFHLGNGARLERIHANADPSPKGMRESWGVMVNYLYDLKDIEANHEAYNGGGAIVCGPVVEKTLNKIQKV